MFQPNKISNLRKNFYIMKEKFKSNIPFWVPWSKVVCLLFLPPRTSELREDFVTQCRCYHLLPRLWLWGSYLFFYYYLFIIFWKKVGIILILKKRVFFSCKTILFTLNKLSCYFWVVDHDYSTHFGINYW